MRIVFLVHEELELSLLPGQWLPLFGYLEKNQHTVDCCAFVSWRDFFNLGWRAKMRRRFVVANGKQLPIHFFLKTSPKVDAFILSRWLDGRRPGDRSEPSILHARGPVASWLAIRARDVFGVAARVVADFRGITPEEWRLAGGYGRRNAEPWIRQLETFEKISLQKADAAFFVTERLAQYLQQKYQTAVKRKAVIPCYIEDELTTMPASNDPRYVALQNKTANRLVLLYSGGAAVWQKVEALLRLQKIINDKGTKTVLLLLSPHPDNWRRQLTEAGLTSTDYELLSLTQTAAVQFSRLATFAFLLRDDNPINDVAFPVKFAEYLAAGVPVVISQAVSTCAAMLEKFTAGYVLPSLDDPALHDLAARLVKIWQQPEYRTMQASAKRLANQELRFSRYQDEILKLYKTTIDDNVQGL